MHRFAKRQPLIFTTFCSQHHDPKTNHLRPEPKTQQPKSKTLDPKQKTLNAKSHNRYLKFIYNSRFGKRLVSPEPETRNPQHQTPVVDLELVGSWIGWLVNGNFRNFVP